MKTTKNVIDHHLQAIGEGLDSILSDYNENACIMSPQGTFKGKAAIKTFFTQFIEGMPEGMMDSFKVKKIEVDGDVGYLLWDANPFVPTGTDTFVVKNGKIVYQTLAMHAN